MHATTVTASQTCPLVSSACIQWPAVITVACTPIRVHSTFRTCFCYFGFWRLSGLACRHFGLFVSNVGWKCNLSTPLAVRAACLHGEQVDETCFDFLFCIWCHSIVDIIQWQLCPLTVPNYRSLILLIFHSQMCCLSSVFLSNPVAAS